MMRSAETWFLFDWHWAFVAFCAVLLTGAGLVARAGVLYMRVERHEVARFDAYLDDVEDGYIDLPGPEAPAPWVGECHYTYDDKIARVPPPPPWVGELHPYETAFPAMLQIGQPGDGTEKMFTRMDMYRMTVHNAVEAARRELAAECGIRYVPMELAAA